MKHKKKIKNIRYFSNFHKFRIYHKNIFDGMGVFKPKDVEHTIRVCFQISKSTARFLTEKTFVELFQYSEEMEAYLKTVNIKAKCESNRTETFETMSKKNDIFLDYTLVKRTFHVMAKQTALMGHKFRKISFSDALNYMPKSTSSSFPDHVTPKADNFSHIIWQNKSCNKEEEWRFFDECLIGTQWRTQISRSNELKFRQFYPLPHYIQALERQYFNGFFIHFEKYKDTPYAYANIWPNMKRRYINCQKYKYTYSLDIKGFDMNISNTMIKLVLDWMKSFLILNDEDQAMVNSIIEYHLNANVLLSSDRETIIFNKERGLLSGSTLTNLLGSMISMFCIQYYTLSSTRTTLSNVAYTVHGDDNIFGSDRKIKIDDIAEFYKKHFGLTISMEKSEVFNRGEQIYFLGHYIDTNGRYLNKDRMIRQLCFGSSYIDKSIMSSSERIISKLCSLLFKCVDGWDTFLSLKDRLLGLLDLSELPKYYQEITSIGGTILNKNMAEAKDQWMLC